MELVNRGRKMLIFVITITLTISIALAIFEFLLGYQTFFGWSQDVIRFFLTCLLFYFVYRGNRPARVIAIVLYGISGFGSLIASFTFSTFMLVFAVPYTISFFILLSKPVKAYHHYKKSGIVDSINDEH